MDDFFHLLTFTSTAISKNILNSKIQDGGKLNHTLEDPLSFKLFKTWGNKVSEKVLYI